MNKTPKTMEEEGDQDYFLRCHKEIAEAFRPIAEEAEKTKVWENSLEKRNNYIEYIYSFEKSHMENAIMVFADYLFKYQNSPTYFHKIVIVILLTPIFIEFYDIFIESSKSENHG